MTSDEISGLRDAFAREVAALAGADIRIDIGAAPDTCTGAPLSRVLHAAPLDVAQVAACVRAAARVGLRVMPLGSSRNWGYGHGIRAEPEASIAAVLLDLSGMKRIGDYDPVCGLVSLQPGVTQGELSRYLIERGDAWVGPVTGSSPDCSVISNALERGFGLTVAHDHYMLLRDVTVVLADGSVHSSSMRAMGGDVSARLYRPGIGPDTLGLFSQSDLGIVCGATLTLGRRHERGLITVQVPPHRLGRATDAFRELRQRFGELLPCIKLMNPDYLARVTTEDSQHPDHWRGWMSVSADERLLGGVMREVGRVLHAHRLRHRSASPRTRRLLADARRLGLTRFSRSLDDAARALADIDSLVSGTPSQIGLRFAYGSERMPAVPHPGRDGCGLLWYCPIVRLDGGDVEGMARMVADTMRGYGFAAPMNLTCLDQRSACLVSAVVFDRGQRTAEARDCYRSLVERGLELGCSPYRFADTPYGPSSTMDASSPSLHARLRHALDPDGRFVGARIGMRHPPHVPLSQPEASPA